MGSAAESASRSGTATGARRHAAPPHRLVVCVRNDGYEASLDPGKIYRALPDEDAERDGDIGVVDGSDEDHLFAADRFVAIEVLGAESPRPDAINGAPSLNDPTQ